MELLPKGQTTGEISYPVFITHEDKPLFYIKTKPNLEINIKGENISIEQLKQFLLTYGK